MSNEGQWCDPGYCQLAEVSNYANELKEKLAECEARLGKAVKVLEDLVRDCEADYPPSHGAIKYFCRATLAEIKSGIATTPYGLEGESHE